MLVTEIHVLQSDKTNYSNSAVKIYIFSAMYLQFLFKFDELQANHLLLVYVLHGGRYARYYCATHLLSQNTLFNELW